MTGLRFAVIGCGAMAEGYFFPVLTSRRKLCSSLLAVDPDPARLAAISRRFKVTTASSWDDIPDLLDAAVVAAPHNAHFAIASKLIAAGKHVLCEKPLATNLEEATALVQAAERARVVLMTNNWRRCCPSFGEIKRLIETEDLGSPIAVSWIEGLKFAWPTRSGFYFTQRPRDGLPPPGVLLDVGSHVIDLLCWWLGPEPTVLECRTDSFGGPEARASLVLDFSGKRAEIELSYYQKMANTYSFRFKNSEIHGSVNDDHVFTILRGSKAEFIRVSRRRLSLQKYALGMISNFVAAVTGRAQPLVSGRDVLPSIKTITAAYRQAQQFPAPWLPRPEA